MPTHDLIYTANIVNGIENSELNTQNSIIIYDLYGLGDGSADDNDPDLVGRGIRVLP